MVKIQWVEAFLAIEKAMSFSTAAEELYISQSSLTKYIQALERELETKLFIRNGHHLALSNSGHAFRICAAKLWADYLDMQTVMLQFNKNKSLKLATVSLTCYEHASFIFSELPDMIPQIPFYIQETSSENVLMSLKTDKTTVAILRDMYFEKELPEDKFDNYTLAQDQLVTLFSDKHSFNNRKTITLRDCVEVPLALISAGYYDYEYAFQTRGMSLEVSRECSLIGDFSRLIECIVHKNCISFISKSAAMFLCSQYPVIYKEIEDAPNFSLSVVLRKDATPQMVTLAKKILSNTMKDRS